jgi:hypothetical protein
MDQKKIKKQIANAKYYQKNIEELRVEHRTRAKTKYEDNAEFRLKKIASIKQRYYVNNSIQFVRFLFEE